MRSISACLLLAAAPVAHAAFYVADAPPSSPLIVGGPASVRDAQADDPAVHKVPFAARSTQLSSAAKRALVRILPVAQSVSQVVVSGCADSNDSEVTAYRRASEIKAWFLMNGVPDEAVKVRTGTSPSTVKVGNTFNCLVSFSDTVPGSATIPPSHNPSLSVLTKAYVPAAAAAAAAAATTTPSRPTGQLDPRIWMVQSVLEMVAAKTLKADDAIAMLDRIIKAGNLTASTSPAPNPAPAAAPSLPTMQQAVAMPPLKVVPVLPAEWELRAGSTLQAVLEQWSRQAGWNPPIWRASNPFQVAAGGTLRGTYMEALRELSKAVPQLDITVSPDGRSLVVTDAKSVL
uniref:TcpQ domain-containing protein n=1 Tax=Cupriavidus gilardii TaxID=82541 RepID=UPI00247AA818|nr:TcpQ domain-containing protein [Cupriavidus gilardii]WDE72703.1 hypothetical protein [Cupriavidus gilardii]